MKIEVIMFIYTVFIRFQLRVVFISNAKAHLGVGSEMPFKILHTVPRNNPRQQV